MRIVSGITLTLFLLGVSTLAFKVNSVPPAEFEFPALYIEPAITVDEELTLGKNYTISIHTDYNGSDIWGYQFSLNYNSLVLEGVEVVNGDLISAENVTFIPGTFNNTEGELWLTMAYSLNLSAPLPWPRLNNTGPGVLATVTFTIVGYGKSSITLGYQTMLVSVDGTHIVDAVNMPDHIGHGYFNNVPSSPAEATQELIETIETWHLSKGLENSLISKLDNVIHLLDKGNEKGASHKLIVFINQVEALQGKKLTIEQANYLIAEAQRIKNLIEG